MSVATHAFRDAFIFHERAGFAVVFEDEEWRAGVAVPFIAQKHDPSHLRVTVFESAVRAENDRQRFPPKPKLVVQAVSKDEVMAFAKVGYFGMPAIVFLRDENGVDAIL
jgi:hypothetical protein